MASTKKGSSQQPSLFIIRQNKQRSGLRPPEGHRKSFTMTAEMNLLSLGEKLRCAPSPGQMSRKPRALADTYIWGLLGTPSPSSLLRKRMLIILFPFLSHVTCSLREAGGLGITWGTRAGVSDFPPCTHSQLRSPYARWSWEGGAKSPVSRRAWAGPFTVSICVETPLERIHVTCVTKENFWKILSSRSTHTD